MITARLGKRSVTVPSSVTSTASLHHFLHKELALSDGQFRIVVKGKTLHLTGPDMGLAEAGVTPGARLMLMYTSDAAVNHQLEARPERMRCFEDDDKRTRFGGLGGPSGVRANSRSVARQSPHRFQRQQALQTLPPESSPDPSAAVALLERLANDSSILALLESHRWSVGLLAEMAPEGKVGVSASCRMGFNRNRGQEIHLRLRTDDYRGLRPYQSVVEVLLHELAHNVHDDHDNSFKTLNSQLRTEYRAHCAAAIGQTISSTGDLAPTSSEVPSKAQGSRALGGVDVGAIFSPQEAAARAAMRRLGEDKCFDCAEITKGNK